MRITPEEEKEASVGWCKDATSAGKKAICQGFRGKTSKVRVGAQNAAF
jgi:hypothetical protein